MSLRAREDFTFLTFNVDLEVFTAVKPNMAHVNSVRLSALISAHL